MLWYVTLYLWSCNQDVFTQKLHIENAFEHIRRAKMTPSDDTLKKSSYIKSFDDHLHAKLTRKKKKKKS